MVVSSFGYPSVPRPVFGPPDGSRRLPAGLDPLAARDPTWWLDDETKAQRDGESDEAYAIRIHLELLARGQVDPESLVWHNPLRDVGIDVRTPGGRARVIAYRDGGDDPELRALVVGPELREEVPLELEQMPDWPAAIATELLACHEAAYERVAQECDALIASMVDGVAETLRSADFGAAASGLTAAIERLRSGASPQASRREVEAALDEVLDLVAGMVEDELVVRGELTLRSATAAEVLAYGDRCRESYQQRCAARSAEADRLLGLLYRDPADGGARLVEFCRHAWDQATAAVELTLEEWRRPDAAAPEPGRPRRNAPYGVVPAAEIYGAIALPSLPSGPGGGGDA